MPQRTCIGCRSTLSKKELIRIVRTPQGVLVDPTGKAAGRGAYIHKVRSCWEKALKGPINHALRVEITPADRQMLEQYISQLPVNETLTLPDQSLSGDEN